jgi:glycine/D-amino acid oxidase-like deaminating enzyme
MARSVNKLGARAVVIGAGIGGLTAAAAIAPFFDHITVLDGDELPDNAETRKAVAEGQRCTLFLRAASSLSRTYFRALARSFWLLVLVR